MAPRSTLIIAAMAAFVAVGITAVALALGASGPDLMRLPGEQAVLSAVDPVPAAPAPTVAAALAIPVADTTTGPGVADLPHWITQARAVESYALSIGDTRASLNPTVVRGEAVWMATGYCPRWRDATAQQVIDHFDPDGTPAQIIDAKESVQAVWNGWCK